MNEKDNINTYISNAIRTLHQMIVLVDDGSFACHILDHNRELSNLGEPAYYGNLRDSLYVNVHPEDREGFAAFSEPGHLVKELSARLYVMYQCRIRRSNGRYYWSEIVICNGLEEDRTDGNEFLILIRDINRWKKKELRAEAEQRAMLGVLRDEYDRLFEENMRDEQTGCYNRKGMNYYTDLVLEDARRNGKHLFVCVSDLNGLKHLNDTYGHAAGDEAIAAVSSELLKAAPTGSRIVRTGGDEFLLMAALDPDSREPEEMGPKLDQGIAAYNQANPRPFMVGASYGWVFLPPRDDMTDLDEYIEMADARMYEMRAERDQYRRD